MSPSSPRRWTPLVVALSTAVTALPAAAAGKVEVNYVQPENFADAGRGTVDREHTLKLMTEYLQSLASQLPDGQTLRLEVTDLDLAGSIEPFGWRSSSDVRVMRGRADWPHMNLRYTLVSNGSVVKSGEAQLADISYMYSLQSSSRVRSGDALAYEKNMVRRWFDATFAAH